MWAECGSQSSHEMIVVTAKTWKIRNHMGSCAVCCQSAPAAGLQAIFASDEPHIMDVQALCCNVMTRAISKLQNCDCVLPANMHKVHI